MEIVVGFLRSLFVVDSIWAVMTQAAVWFIISVIIIVSTDNVDPDITHNKIRTNLGYFSIFLILSGLLFFMLFGYTPIPA